MAYSIDDEPGTFLTMDLDNNSYEKIKNHYEGVNGIGKIQTKMEMHCTIVDFWVPIFVPKEVNSEDYIIGHHSYKHRILNRKSGSKALLLTFYNYKLNELHNKILKDFDITHKHAYFLQHLTISFDLNKSLKIENIPFPKFDIKLTEFSGSEGVDTSNLESELDDMEWWN